MITVFHGDNPSQSRLAFSDFISQFIDFEILHLDSKTFNLDHVNSFLNGGSLLPGKKLLLIDNFFSVPKPVFDKTCKLINQTDSEIVIWQDKPLITIQLKNIPRAKVNNFKADNRLYACLNSLKPHNLTTFNNLYDTIVSQELFDLFLYLLKAKFRRQLQSYSQNAQALIKKIYLQIIELEYQSKTGQLTLPKEIALKRVLIPLLK